ncbi:MAG: tyrosine/phenylalanine carboxypeptidase domain-containing protein [Polyangiaceae bacterium]
MSYAAWVSGADKALTLAAGQIRLIRAVTPSNVESERAALEEAFRRGSTRLPKWRYDPLPVPPDLPRALEALADFLDKEPPLGPIYAARARELCLEAAIVEATGTPRLTALAKQRFLDPSAVSREDGERADAMALAWTSDVLFSNGAGIDCRGGNGEATEERSIRTCDESDPRSLVSRMNAEVGKRRLPMRVSVHPGMASLAATGDGVILVAENKWVAPKDVERTVLHEIEGHALPRARAARAPIALFAIGTARGIDDQEGRAIAIEEAAGFLDNARRFELGCRHLAARATHDGADFVDVVALLQGRHATVEDALRIAARVQRGGLTGGGLSREVVYLASRCKLARLTAGEDGRKIEDVMRGGRVAADVALDLAAALRQEIDGIERNPSVTRTKSSRSSETR